VSALVDALRAARIVDASPLLRTAMPVFPGHPPVVVDGEARTHPRDGYFLQTLSLGEHAGSHVDAPAHALAGRTDATIDTFPLERFVVPYGIVDLAPLGLGAGDLATAADLDAALADGVSPEPGDAVLLHFGWDRHRDRQNGWWAANAPGLDEGACRLLAERRPGLVGSDPATCDTAVVDGRIVADHGHATYFLPNDILLVEGLLGLGDAPRRGVFVGAPLRIEGGSASPIRALLIAEADG
jgi:kynurenine formamidase